MRAQLIMWLKVWVKGCEGGLGEGWYWFHVETNQYWQRGRGDIRFPWCVRVWDHGEWVVWLSDFEGKRGGRVLH